FDKKLQQEILKDRKPMKGRAGGLIKTVDLEALREKLTERPHLAISQRDAVGAALFDKVFDEFAAGREKHGDVSPVPTKNFLFGMDIQEEISIEIEPGKTLIVKLINVSEPAKDGTRKVNFELNGMPREAIVKDRKIKSASKEKRKADAGNPHHLGATMPGLIGEVKVGKA